MRLPNNQPGESVLQFLWVWNDLLVATIFTSGSNFPITKLLTDLVGTYGQTWYLLSAGTFLAIIVPLIVFFALQRRGMPSYPVQVRRIYEDAAATDGSRVLVDRLWPRGVSKTRAQLTLWLKTVAPSAELRQWYAHDPQRFDEFAARYGAELAAGEQSEALQTLRDLRASGPLTVLTATRDAAISEAAVLQRILG